MNRNASLSSVADVQDTNPWKPEGTYQFEAGHDWTAWGNYAHFQSSSTDPGWTAYCNGYVGHLGC